MKNKVLPWVIALSALSVSGSAAFYSVSGLGKMFAGASLQVMVLAGSLEFAKLVIASLLYQYWSKLNIALKSYLSIATIILILITSAGIYGFLSSAYQETAFKVENQDKNVAILDKNISIIQAEIKNFESQSKQKNDRVSQLTAIRRNLQSTQDVLIEKSKSTAAVTKQIKEVESEIKRMDTEISVLNDSISSKNSKIAFIEQEKLKISSDADLAKEVGPLKYIASLTGKDIGEVVNWYIIVLMLVFDPLAIALVIASNFAFEMSKNNNEEKKTEEKKVKNKNIKWLKFFKRKEKVKEVQDKVVVNPPMDPVVDPENVEEEIIKADVIEEANPERIEEKTSNITETTEHKLEDNEKELDKYDDPIFLENQRILRERFRKNPGGPNSRDTFRNNSNGDVNPLNLR